MFDSGDVAIMVQQLAAVRRDFDDAVRIDLIRELENLKSACAAAQAKTTADLKASRIAERAAQGVPVAHRTRGIAAEVALARRDSHAKGDTHLGFATAMTEMPHTLALLESGALSEYRASLLVRETACLTREDRGIVDAELCADTRVLDGVGNRTLSAKAKSITARLDVDALVKRAEKAVGDRRVSVRPAPDCMAYLTALLPMRDAVTVQATLLRDAAGVVAVGDVRTKSQIMADLLIERTSGVSTTVGPPVAVNLVISDDALLGDGTADAHVDGYGPIPATLARKWVAQTSNSDAEMTLRKVYANPRSGALTAMESKSRYFPKGLAALVDIRDRVCRTPWCDAPIRHIDHIDEHHNGGATSAVNAAGLCEACNYAKQAAGWTAQPEPAKPAALHSYSFTTPTGHNYRSTAPPLPTPIGEEAA